MMYAWPTMLCSVFHGISGFRWPFCNTPNTQAPPVEIFINTWKCVEALYNWDLVHIYCCIDGSSNNRAFLKMHFPETDPLCTQMVAKCYKDPTRELIFMMDPSHLLKKFRNSIFSSSIGRGHTRLMELKSGEAIMWQMWIDQWDKSFNPFPVHNKLTDEHLFPSDSQKMRNKLANEVLDGEMLNLMQCYKSSLSPEHGKQLDGAIAILHQTSLFVSLFRDPRPICDLCDERLIGLDGAYFWFKEWERQISIKTSSSSRKS